MDDTPVSDNEVRNLRFLRILVTILTATMILGLAAIVAMLAIRFTETPAPMALPEEITLPDGAGALAFTRGDDWYAVVTDSNEILIYDAATHDLRQTVTVRPAAR